MRAYLKTRSAPFSVRRWQMWTMRLLTVVMMALPLALPVASVGAQGVLVAPTALVLTESRRSATVTLVNTSSTASDVSIALAFGYPETDSLGQMRLVLQDAPADSMPSAVPLLSVYPSRVLLPPGATRVVRLVATAPLPTAHEHWARLVVTSRAAAGTAASTAGANGTDSTQASLDPSPEVALSLEVRSILGVFYRPSQATTSLVASAPETKLHEGKLNARLTLKREGSAAYVGTLRAVLRDSLGVARGEAQVPLGVYYELSPSVSFDMARLPQGKYAVEWRATTDRADVPSTLLTPGAVVQASTDVRVP
ncbi:MAG: molecular chaperone [Gemmatimonadaceae bacterium]|nr:molecular chaperone [Gemmatimonadaceae bacterium]